MRENIAWLKIFHRQPRIKLSKCGKCNSSIDLPDKVELKLIQTEQEQTSSGTVFIGLLETGARLELPKNIESGSVIIVDTKFGRFDGLRKSRIVQ